MDELSDALNTAVQAAPPHTPLDQLAAELERCDPHFHSRAVVMAMRRDIVGPEVHRVVAAFLDGRSTAATEAAQTAPNSTLAADLAALILSDAAALERLGRESAAALRGVYPPRTSNDAQAQPGARRDSSDVLDLLAPSDELENSMDKGDAPQTTRQRLLPCIIDLLSKEERAEAQRAEEAGRRAYHDMSGSEGGSSAPSSPNSSVDFESMRRRPVDMAAAARTMQQVGAEDCLASEFWQHLIRRACDAVGLHRNEAAAQEAAIGFVVAMLRTALPEQLAVAFELFSQQCVRDFQRLDDRGKGVVASGWHTAAVTVTARWAYLAPRSAARISDVAVATCVQLDGCLSAMFPTAPWACRWFEKPLVANAVSIAPLVAALGGGAAVSPHAACVLCCICDARAKDDVREGLAALVDFAGRSMLGPMRDGRHTWTSPGCREATLFVIGPLYSTLCASQLQGRASALQGHFAAAMLKVLGADGPLQLGDAADDGVAAVALMAAVRHRPSILEVSAGLVLATVTAMRSPGALVQCVPDAMSVVGSQLGPTDIEELLLHALPLCGQAASASAEQLAIARAVCDVFTHSPHVATLPVIVEFLFAVLCEPFVDGGNSTVPPLFFAVPACCAVAPAASDIQARYGLLQCIGHAVPEVLVQFIALSLASGTWRGICPPPALTASSAVSQIVATVLSADAGVASILRSPANHVTFSQSRFAFQRAMASSRKLCVLLVMLVAGSGASTASRLAVDSTHAILTMCGLQLGLSGCEAVCLRWEERHQVWRWLLFAASCSLLMEPSQPETAALMGETASHAMGEQSASDGCDPIAVCQRLVALMFCENVGCIGGVPPEAVHLAAAGFDAVESEEAVLRCGQWMQACGGAALSPEDGHALAKLLVDAITAATWNELVMP